MYKSSLFRSVDIRDFRFFTECSDGPALEGPFGFTLIDGNFVPYAFIDKIEANLNKQPWQYGSALRADMFVKPEFWESLDADDREMVGPCLLILMEHGRICLFQREGYSGPSVEPWIKGA